MIPIAMKKAFIRPDKRCRLDSPAFYQRIYLMLGTFTVFNGKSKIYFDIFNSQAICFVP
jgi:hypothetical protein